MLINYPFIYLFTYPPLSLSITWCAGGTSIFICTNKCDIFYNSNFFYLHKRIVSPSLEKLNSVYIVSGSDRTIEILNIERVLLSFFGENFVSTKDNFGNSNSYGRKFHKVVRSAIVFLSNKVYKNI